MNIKKITLTHFTNIILNYTIDYRDHCRIIYSYINIYFLSYLYLRNKNIIFTRSSISEMKIAAPEDINISISVACTKFYIICIHKHTCLYSSVIL